MLYKNLSLLVILFLMQQNHCNDGWGDNRGPVYDISQISVGEHNVYFKREIRGRNYEGLSISSDGDFCNGPSPKTDFFVESETIGIVFYKVRGDELQIYSQNVFTPPQTDNNFPIKIVQRQIPVAEHNGENAIKLGYTELIFTDDSVKSCNK